MIDPLFWLGLSLLLVSFSLFAVLLVTIPTLQEVARAARSAEKLFDTLNREFPPTLEAIRMTGKEVGELTDELNQGINNATGVVKQVDRGLVNARIQAQQVQESSRGLIAGVKVAWKTWRNPPRRKDLAEFDRAEDFTPSPSSKRKSADNW
ncbi:hypothetical protein I4641_21855 [Waterburya agarophytonicola K14]|uniref:DUF948 domain-containing protein n=1 Tax=Waterburya agarophytonicola KI4 TaxID=2874699 RepID=A0A964FH37_9CYAN|nr:hypothetical protein [Waterburya agarophytonicola]MCC0179605.1 hypothetical protein [Waterburya agarophytonicola KI4]